MPDFLEKLHNAALRAKNLEVGIHDYTGIIKSNDTTRQPSQERLGGENPHTSGTGQIYAWDCCLIWACVFTWAWTPVNPPTNYFSGRCVNCRRKLQPTLVGRISPSIDLFILVVDETRIMHCADDSNTVLRRKNFAMEIFIRSAWSYICFAWKFFCLLC